MVILVRDNWSKVTDQKGAAAHDYSSGKFNKSLFIKSHHLFLEVTAALLQALEEAKNQSKL